MKKLLLLVGLVVFLTPMVVSAEEKKTFECISYECNILVKMATPGTTDTYKRGQTIISYDSIIEMNKRRAPNPGEWKEWEEEKPSEEELEIKKKISILKVLLNEGDINKQQYEELKFIVISYHLTGSSNNTNEVNEESQILKDQLNELKKQTNIQSNDSTLRNLCVLFKSMRGINSIFNTCL